MAFITIAVVFLSLHDIMCVLGRNAFHKGRPDKNPGPSVSPSPSGGNWVRIDVPPFTEWEAQKGFGCQYGICGWGNEEFQFYHPEPFGPSGVATAEAHTLTVRALLNDSLISDVVRHNCSRWCQSNTKPDTDVSDCTSRCESTRLVSARIRSQGVFAFAPDHTVLGGNNAKNTYRSFKVSMTVRAEDGTGLWPAVWMLPEDVGEDTSSGYGKYGDWPFSGEIDIFESANNMRRQWSTIHYAVDQYGTDAGLGRSSSFDSKPHTIEFIWNPDSMVWFKDGREVQTLSGWNAFTANSSSSSAPFDQRFHFLINLACGGGHTGQTDPATIENTLSMKGGQASFTIENFQVWGLS